MGHLINPISFRLGKNKFWGTSLMGKENFKNSLFFTHLVEVIFYFLFKKYFIRKDYKVITRDIINYSVIQPRFSKFDYFYTPVYSGLLQRLFELRVPREFTMRPKRKRRVHKKFRKFFKKNKKKILKRRNKKIVSKKLRRRFIWKKFKIRKKNFYIPEKMFLKSVIQRDNPLLGYVGLVFLKDSLLLNFIGFDKKCLHIRFVVLEVGEDRRLIRSIVRKMNLYSVDSDFFFRSVYNWRRLDFDDKLVIKNKRFKNNSKLVIKNKKFKNNSKSLIKEYKNLLKLKRYYRSLFIFRTFSAKRRRQNYINRKRVFSLLCASRFRFNKDDYMKKRVNYYYSERKKLPKKIPKKIFINFLKKDINFLYTRFFSFLKEFNFDYLSVSAFRCLKFKVFKSHFDVFIRRKFFENLYILVRHITVRKMLVLFKFKYFKLKQMVLKLIFLSKIGLYKVLRNLNLNRVIIHTNLLELKEITTEQILKHLQIKFKIGYNIGLILKHLKPSMNFIRNQVCGYKVCFAGRFNKRQIATYRWIKHNKLSLNRTSSSLEYASGFIVTKHGACGIKVWVQRRNQNSNSNFLYSN